MKCWWIFDLIPSFWGKVETILWRHFVSINLYLLFYNCSQTWSLIFFSSVKFSCSFLIPGLTVIYSKVSFTLGANVLKQKKYQWNFFRISFKFWLPFLLFSLRNAWINYLLKEIEVFGFSLPYIHFFLYPLSSKTWEIFVFLITFLSFVIPVIFWWKLQ